MDRDTALESTTLNDAPHHLVSRIACDLTYIAVGIAANSIEVISLASLCNWLATCWHATNTYEISALGGLALFLPIGVFNVLILSNFARNHRAFAAKSLAITNAIFWLALLPVLFVVVGSKVSSSAIMIGMVLGVLNIYAPFCASWVLWKTRSNFERQSFLELSFHELPRRLTAIPILLLGAVSGKFFILDPIIAAHNHVNLIPIEARAVWLAALLLVIGTYYLLFGESARFSSPTLSGITLQEKIRVLIVLTLPFVLMWVGSSYLTNLGYSLKCEKAWGGLACNHIRFLKNQ